MLWLQRFLTSRPCLASQVGTCEDPYLAPGRTDRLVLYLLQPLLVPTQASTLPARVCRIPAYSWDFQVSLRPFFRDLTFWGRVWILSLVV